jgi:hypothetical protein
MSIMKRLAGQYDPDADEQDVFQVKRDIEFLEDPDIYEKTGVRKPRNGEQLTSMDADNHKAQWYNEEYGEGI